MRNFTYSQDWENTVSANRQLSSQICESRPADRGGKDRIPKYSKVATTSVPIISRRLLQWFTWYARRYLRGHFHSLRLSRSGSPPFTRLPLVIYSNHASWWDPLVCLVLKAEFYPERQAFAPMDAVALKRYQFFSKLGFFGIEQGHLRGAVQFLSTSQAILSNPGHILALTPQGRFTDVRERPVRFQAGLGYLAARVKHALFVPMAAEFAFWEERLPEILVRFGNAMEIQQEQGDPRSPAEWTRLLEQQLADNQDKLAQEVQARRTNDFQHVLQGGAGQGGIYDYWRAAKACLAGARFRKEHGVL